MSRLLRNLAFPLFLLVMALAIFIRFWMAPLSAGPDVAQFWAFAEVFRQHGLDFYRYASADFDFFPFRYWSYVYPPLWLLLLGLALLAVPDSVATNVNADPSWRIAMKTPIIMADLAIGALLYWAIPGSRYKRLFFAGLWLLHPTGWYNSAIFGQFDAVAAAFLLASVVFFERGRDRWAFTFAAFAVLTKQHALLALALVLVYYLRQRGWQLTARNTVIAAAIIAAFSVPFLLTGNLVEYARSILFPAQEPEYQFPLYLSFSGSGSLLTYLHNTRGWDTEGLLSYNSVVVLAALVGAAFVAWRRRITPARGALIGILLFVAFFYRINYQYLVMFIPAALLVAAWTPHWSERVFALALALFPAVWVWLFNVAAWFYNLTPHQVWVIPIFKRLGMTREMSDGVYVAFAVTLMGLSLAYAVLGLTVWKRPLRGH